MPISFTCPDCLKDYSVKDELAGKKANCTCGATIEIPDLTVPKPAEDDDPLGLGSDDDPLGVSLTAFTGMPPPSLGSDPLKGDGTSVPGSGINQSPLVSGNTGGSEAPAPSSNKKVVIVSSAISGGVGFFLGVIIMVIINFFSGFFLGSASSEKGIVTRKSLTSTSKKETAKKSDFKTVPASSNASRDTGPIGRPSRGNLGPLEALNGQWKLTHFYKHSDKNIRDGGMGAIAEDLTDDADRSKTWSMYYDSNRKIWAQSYPDGTIARGKFDVLPDQNYPGKFNMKIVYHDGSGSWKVDNMYYLSNNNTQLDHQWIRRFGKGSDAKRWVYVGTRTSP